MSDEEVYNLSLSVPGADEGETLNVAVRIAVKDGNIVSIKGTGDGNDYDGTLTLKLVSGTVIGALCIVCDPYCHVVVPCP
jgi:hypothetical protein